MQPWQPIDRIPMIPEGEIAVFRCALAGALEEVAALRILLAANELERLDRFQSESAAVAFLQTRALVRRMLAATLGCSIEDVVLAPNAAGKPEIASPGNPGLAFNATHTRGWGGVAVARIPNCEIGLDFEVHNPARDIAALAARHYSPEEQRLLEAQPDDAARLQAFFDLWTAKEACIKATGKGLAADLRTINVAEAIDEKRNHSHFNFGGLPRAAMSVRGIAMPAEYSGAIALAAMEAKPTAFSRVQLFDFAIHPDDGVDER